MLYCRVIPRIIAVLYSTTKNKNIVLSNKPIARKFTTQRNTTQRSLLNLNRKQTTVTFPLSHCDVTLTLLRDDLQACAGLGNSEVVLGDAREVSLVLLLHLDHLQPAGHLPLLRPAAHVHRQVQVVVYK